MQVEVLKKVIYKGAIYDKGAKIEVDDTTAYVLERRGLVKIEVGAEVGGLPELEVGKEKK